MQNHHPLISEFPELKDKIHELKISDAHFRRLACEYEGVDKSIVRIEQGINTVSDDHLNILKKERVALKDILYRLLSK